jgi:transcriptional regulator with XRE-family HTH domain
LNNTDTAYVLQTSRRTLGRIRQANPGYTPSTETLDNIADAFGVPRQQVTRRLPAAVIYSVL